LSICFANVSNVRTEVQKPVVESVLMSIVLAKIYVIKNETC